MVGEIEKCGTKGASIQLKDEQFQLNLKINKLVKSFKKKNE